MVAADNVEKSSLQHNKQEREGSGCSAAVEHSSRDHEVGGFVPHRAYIYFFLFQLSITKDRKCP